MFNIRIELHYPLLLFEDARTKNRPDNIHEDDLIGQLFLERDSVYKGCQNGL